MIWLVIRLARSGSRSIQRLEKSHPVSAPVESCCKKRIKKSTKYYTINTFQTMEKEEGRGRK